MTAATLAAAIALGGLAALWALASVALVSVARQLVATAAELALGSAPAPARITTSAAHGLRVGDVVELPGYGLQRVVVAGGTFCELEPLRWWQRLARWRP